MKKNKEKLIEDFLQKLGTVKGKGFTVICNSCKSDDVTVYSDTWGGSEYTGAWGEAGYKCKNCGNAEEITDY